MKPIKLYKKEGPVVFLGGINAMPMMYALELRRKGVEVLYFVDRPSKDLLSRPENHFKDIGYPYPDWIVEWVWPTQIFFPIFPEIFAYLIEKKINKKTKKRPQTIFLNGFFCSLAPYFMKSVPKIFLPGGADLDSWADVEMADNLAKNFSGRSIFKYIPNMLSYIMINKIVERQFFGASKCSKVIYFPKGFNKAGDRVLSKLESKGVEVYDRYDISFEPLKYEKRGGGGGGEKMVIFSGVRFLFETFPNGNLDYNKGNNIIIEGLAKYYKRNKNIEIHFVEKGEDVYAAKKMCSELGLADVVIWHKEMKFTELLEIYQKSDVCFDQVGRHWIGAIGFYALWLGKPLIANDERPIEVGAWGMQSPILSAKNANDIEKNLIKLELKEFKEKISKESMFFAERELGPQKVLNKIFLNIK